MRAVRLRDVRSKPPTWLWDEMIPQGHVTLIFGRGGVGKTYLLLAVATCVASGIPLLGRSVKTGRTLILDAELSEGEAAHRALQVARGMGLSEIPEGLVYVRLSGSIFEPRVADEIRALVKEYEPLLVVVDALSSAAPESDPTEAVAARKVLTDLLSLGTTVLAIDHVSKATANARGGTAQPLGSVAKENIMRSGFSVEQTRGGMILLTHTKSTFGPLVPPMLLRATITNGEYRLEMAGERKEQQQPDRKARIVALLAEHPEGLTSDDVAASLGTSKKSALNRLGELMRDGVLKRTSSGGWTLEEGQ